jgi:hypothetical protein
LRILDARSPALRYRTREALDAMRRRLSAQDRRKRELEGEALTRDEKAAAVDHCLVATPARTVRLCGADERGRRSCDPNAKDAEGGVLGRA